MAQSTILAAGNTAASSTDVVVAAGDTVTVGIFAAAGGSLPASVAFRVEIDTPGTNAFVNKLTQTNRVTVIAGPCTARVRRPAYTGTAFGVFLEN